MALLASIYFNVRSAHYPSQSTFELEEHLSPGNNSIESLLQMDVRFYPKCGPPLKHIVPIHLAFFLGL
jgi:hypothetical protein